MLSEQTWESNRTSGGRLVGAGRAAFPPLRKCGPGVLVAALVAPAIAVSQETVRPIGSPALRLEPQSAETTALLQAVAPVDDEVVWVSGHEGTWLRSEDGGSHWRVGVVDGAEELQFRDVAARDARTAWLMSAGPGPLSRIYRTDDAGRSWALHYTADHPDAFLDCLDFWDGDRGLAYGDAVDGVPFILKTDDGGNTWARVSPERLPAALEGEGGFAASGTCLTTGEGGQAWIATGNGPQARVLATADFGFSWSVVDAPVVGGAASGLATIQVEPDGFGIALGGVIGNDSIRSDNVAVTGDGGASWAPGGRLAMPGPVYGSAVRPGAGERRMVVAVGPRGMDVSHDGGRSWISQDSLTYWAVAFVSSGRGWAVGPEGRIVRLALDP